MRTEKFKIFNSEKWGRIFVPDGQRYEELEALYISPLHGRAVAVKTGEYQWLNVKGGGWNYGGPQVYISKKDEELIFGLYPLDSAIRELAVSKEIEKISADFPKVLYYKKLKDFALSEEYLPLQSVKFRSGQPVNPCILYTQMKCPMRVADLIYFTDKEKREAVAYCCKYWNVSVQDYVKTFLETLARRVALLHKYGFINDTLDYGNVTMLGEIMDYEWITAPNVALLDGSDGLILTDERKEKEILYGAEICLQLKAMLQEEYNLYDIYKRFVEAYGKVDSAFIQNNPRIQKMLKKEEIIL